MKKLLPKQFVPKHFLHKILHNGKKIFKIHLNGIKKWIMKESCV